MNSIAIVAFFAALAVANASVIVPSTHVLQAPSSRSTLVGPDGSAITSENLGGQIITEDHSELVAHAAPALVDHITYAAPSLLARSAYAAPSLIDHFAYTAPSFVGRSAYNAPTLISRAAYGVPTVLGRSAYATPILDNEELDSVVAGPSGTIITRKSVDYPTLLSRHVPNYYSGLYY